MAPRDDPVVLLDGTCADPQLLGGKGAALDRLIAWSLPVPAAGVVTTAAYLAITSDPVVADVVAAIRSGRVTAADEVDAAFLRGRPPQALVDGILSTARRVAGDGRLAIRSSATVEDLAHVSFAGQYDSFLDIDPDDEEAVIRAVLLVFASLWHPAPCAYRRSFGIDETVVAMAAVMMAMVPAVRAGVVFTVDPGDASMARVEHVPGLADTLVSGQRTPDVVVLARVGDHGAAPSEVADALRLALQVEARAGVPQDVEWAWDGDTVWLVQARPITARSDAATGDGFDDDAADLAGLDLTTAGIGEMLPGVLPPLVWDIGSYLVEEAFRGTFDDLGVALGDLPQRRALLRRVQGRAAMDFSLLASRTATLPGATAEQMEDQYFGSRRPGRAAAAPSAHRRGRLPSARHDLRVLRSRRRSVIDAELAMRAVEQVVAARLDPAAMSDVALLAYWTRLIDLAARAVSAELGVAAGAAAAYRHLELGLIGPLGEAEAGRHAARLTTRSGVTAPVVPSASAAVFAGPTWLELGHAVPAIEHVPPTDDPVEQLRAALQRAAGDGTEGWRVRMKLRLLQRSADEATDQLSRREHTKASVLLLGGEVRRVHLHMGERLVRRGLLRDSADVDLLCVAELRRCFAGGAVPAADVVARRRRWQQRHRADGPLPVRFSGVPERVAVEVPEGSRLDGWAVSGGRFTGRACVVRSPDDPLEPDSVLVAEATDPSWSPMFMRAGAIVLERGGPLSHAAILARELGVPAVTNVAGATRRLDGCTVIVDGDAGIVAVVEPGAAS